MVTCYLILSNHSRRTAPQAAPLRNLCVRRLPRLPRLCRQASRRPGRGVPPPSLLTFNFELLTSSSSTFQCAGRLRRLPRLPRASRALGRGVPPRSLLTFNFELLTSSSSIFQALDSSSLGLTLNLQSEVTKISRSKIPGCPGPEIPTRSGLSTFNRVSFLSPSSRHLCALCVLCGENSPSFRSSLIPRQSPLTTNSFTIRTSKTPLPQLLYNPHLQAPLGSAGNKGLITPLESALTNTAGNKGLITPLESALTKNSPVSLLESALTKRWGAGGPSGRSTLQPPDVQTLERVNIFHSSPLFSDYSTLFCAFLRLSKTQLFCFQAIPNSLRKTPGGWGRGCSAIPKERL